MEGVFPSSGSGIHGDAARVAACRVSLLRLLSLQSLENSAFPGLWVTRTPSGLLSLQGHRRRPGRASIKTPVILSWDFAPLQGLFSAVSAPEHARSAPPLLGFAAFWHLPARRRSAGITSPGTSAHRVSTLSASLSPACLLRRLKRRAPQAFAPPGVSPSSGSAPLSRPSPFLRLDPLRNGLESYSVPIVSPRAPARGSPFAPFLPRFRRHGASFPSWCFPSLRISPFAALSSPGLSACASPRPPESSALRHHRRKSALFSLETAALSEVSPLVRLSFSKTLRPPLHLAHSGKEMNRRAPSSPPAS
jgi:hypothetical protein